MYSCQVSEVLLCESGEHFPERYVGCFYASRANAFPTSKWSVLHQTSIADKTRCWGAGLWSEGDSISSVIMKKPSPPFMYRYFRR